MQTRMLNVAAGTLVLMLLVALLTGCASTRPDGSKARLGDGAITTKLGEIELGQLLDSIQPVLESAGAYDPNIAMAARLLGSRSTRSEDPKGAVKTTTTLYDKKPIDPTLLEIVETWERRSTFKPTMGVVPPALDTNALNAVADKILNSGIMDEVP